MRCHEISLLIPANREDVLVARMALSGLGVVAGLDADMVGDLRTVTNECCDFLLHQAALPKNIIIEGWVEDGRLYLHLTGQGDGGPGDGQHVNCEVARCVLETLMPQVSVDCHDGCVSGITCSTPI